MKRFLIPLLAALALPTTVEANWFGKYGSYREAKEACDKWSNNKGKFKVDYTSHIANHSIRHCDYEEETRQFLGDEQQKKLDQKRVYKEDEIGPWILKKRFKY